VPALDGLFLARKARLKAVLEKHLLSEFESKMMAFDNHPFDEVEPMRPETLYCGIQMKLITALLLCVIN